ncbi:unnamed protein product [Sphagnum jensenii]|uniref:S-protein homolog n=1 Tax=Sphagnum jensenii TaxID=128206 RepID=A0ABP0W0L5_9BRYO
MGADPMARKNHAQASSIAHALIIVALMVVYMEEPVNGKASVSITNALFEPLEVHCHSADDDLGVHILSYYLQKYQFDFNPNIFGTTLFTCDFSAASKQDASQIVWQGYSYGDPPYHCWNCNWYVLSQGFYVDGNSCFLLSSRGSSYSYGLLHGACQLQSSCDYYKWDDGVTYCPLPLS